ncbi:heterokaryon incompatibility protein-domain-containing protein [Aspergillus minisclerotigenes]|uniref:Heterokaryon incompatibility protein-domain-containing protein n=1 Tax=Aspergillus minisclerotigenes TaxID=656917 RepID=A0A5N6JG04_9EURO|nr:heterokaryon incompatibility protein-domain-containing protein [Aspergillus minisclerotigenes]
MIRLLPHEDKSAPIQCELFNYDLSETGLGTHLYQALSYVWGSEMKPESIILNGCIFHVTANLHTALLYLRNRQLERILWVDAICINQDEGDQGHEKSKQIPLMRTIYAQAERVIVWLGDATENGDKALEEIESSDEEIHIPGEAAEYFDDPDPRENYDAYERLLQRDWFSRIWVLQEVGVARCVYIMCGSVYINGHIFCEGLTRLRLSSDLWSRISPVAYLIHGALYRPKYQLGSRGSISIGELIGMYQYHNATKQHDKVYALLGLSADPTTAALEPKYSLPWKEVFKQTINYIFPECSVEAFIETETAVMKSEGWILGVINSVEENASRVGKQKIQVLFNYTARALNYQYCWNTEWELQAAALIQEGDIICLLKGASNPSIIRLCKDHFAVIILAVTPQQRPFLESPAVRPEEMNSMSGLFGIPLIWKTPLARTETKDEPGAMDRHMDTSPIPQGEERRAAEKRLKHIMLAVVDIALTLLNQAKSETMIIEQILRQSGTEGSIAEELAKVCAVSEKVVKRVAGSGEYGPEIMKILFRHRGENLPVSEEVVKATAGNNSTDGPEIMRILFRHLGENLPVSEEVVRAAAGNNGRYGHRILEILIQQSKNLPVSEEVVRAAAGNSGPCGPEIMRILFRHLGENLPVSEEVVKAAAGNNGPYGPEILEILFRHLGENLPVSEEVVKAAAGNDRPHGPRILEVLIQQSKNLPVSEEVVRAAAGNNGPYGHRILEILIQQSKNLPVSEEVVRAAAGNNGRYGPKIIKTLIKQGKNLPVSEEVIRAAAGNSGKFAPEALNILFQHRGGNLPVSEEVVKAAAGNDSPNGYRILEFLFQHRVENLPVSEEVVKAAAGNTGPYRPKVLEILFQFRGESLPVSEEVVKAAAGSSGNMDIKS